MTAPHLETVGDLIAALEDVDPDTPLRLLVNKELVGVSVRYNIPGRLTLQPTNFHPQMWRPDLVNYVTAHADKGKERS